MDQIAQNVDLLRSPEELTAARFELMVRRLANELTYGIDDSRFFGSGVEYAQSRPFVWGDSVRSIDWRVTARTDRTHVKEHVATRRINLWIVVDTSASMAAASTALSKRDVAVWCAAVLALVGLARQSPVAVIGTGLGEQANDWRHSSSRGRLWGRLHALRSARATRGESLSQTLERVEQRSSAACAVVVLSDLHESGAVDAIRNLAQRHECMVGRLADPAELADGAKGFGFVRSREAESGRAMLAHRGGLDVEARSGAAIVGTGAAYELLRTDRPLLPSLQRLIDRGAQGRGTR